ncbi:MAG: Rne/Rng family ribonuclease, partial [Methylibium petroleiphilum]
RGGRGRRERGEGDNGAPVAAAPLSDVAGGDDAAASSSAADTVKPWWEATPTAEPTAAAEPAVAAPTPPQPADVALQALADVVSRPPVATPPASVPVAAPVVARAPAPAPVAIEPVADAAPPAAAAALPPYALPIDDLAAVATSAGLQWVNSDADKVRAVQQAMADAPKPVHVPREPKPVVAIDDGPLVLVETRKDLSQIKLPFEGR